MVQFSASLRLAIGLAFLGVSVFLAAQSLGLGQDEMSVSCKGRAALSETVALYASTEVTRGTITPLKKQFQKIVNRNDDVLSIGLRRGDRLLASTSEHADNWSNEENVDGQIFVPINVHKTHWGRVELCFVPHYSPGVWGFVASRPFLHFLFVMVAAIVLYSIYLRQMLSHLDPSRVIPDRVRSALDTFAEGLLVIDRNERVVLANQSFCNTVGFSTEDLQGRSASDFPWNPAEKASLPWVDALGDGTTRTGRMVDLQVNEHKKITYMVNASPIFSDNGDLQGVLASFDDVTLHEQRKQELERTLRVLGESREKIRKQNEKLRVLATRDPLTGCLNRRAFFEEVQKVWGTLGVGGKTVACIMVDVDHFKSVNDNYGHAAGDEVLRSVGKTLVELESVNALPCRYGGEEFCVMIEDYTEEMAREFAEEIRSVIEVSKPAGIDITASLGVAVPNGVNDNFEEVLERADQGLYVAKRRGRNRVICWSDFEESELESSKEANSSRPDDNQAGESSRSSIPFHAVTALISALSYRDASTAEHSRRVADLCVQLGSKLMTVRDQYVLETAALLHDIGKVGTPDSILLKPGPLDEDEREVMSHHDMIGIEIVRTTFDDDDLIDIVSNHFAWYGGNPRTPGMPTGNEIPLGARILSICDTYDAIVSDRVYRPGASHDAAFAELRRCAGQQFDPQLVEQFIDCVIQSHQYKTKDVANVSKRSALQIGLIMEQMTVALETGNTNEVQRQARCLYEAAADSKLDEIAEIASELTELTVDDAEVDDMLNVATTLLDLCRMTQHAYVGVGAESRRQREQMAKRPFEQQLQLQSAETPQASEPQQQPSEIHEQLTDQGQLSIEISIDDNEAIVIDEAT